jgi:hypothetical protein
MLLFTVLAASTLVAYVAGRLHGWHACRAAMAAREAHARLFSQIEPAAAKAAGDRAAREAEFQEPAR